MKEGEEKIEIKGLSKDVTSLFGLEDNSTVDALKNHLAENFIRRENILKDEKVKKDLQGWVFGSTSNEMKKTARDKYGVEITKDEIASNKVEDLFDLAMSKGFAAKQARISELENQLAEGTDNSTVYEERIAAAERKTIETQNLLKASRQAWEQEIKERDERDFLKNKKNYEASVFSAIPFSSDVDIYKRKGFEVTVKENAQIVQDSEKNWVVKNKNGELLLNPNKVGEYYTPEDYFKDEAVKAGLTQVTPTPTEAPKETPNYSKPAPVSGSPETLTSGGFQIRTKPVGL